MPIEGQICLPAPPEANTLAWMDSKNVWHASSNTERKQGQICATARSSRKWKVIQDTTKAQIDSILWAQIPGDRGLQSGYLVYLHLGINKIENANKVQVLIQNQWSRVELDPENDHLFIPLFQKIPNKKLVIRYTDELNRRVELKTNLPKK